MSVSDWGIEVGCCGRSSGDSAPGARVSHFSTLADDSGVGFMAGALLGVIVA